MHCVCPPAGLRPSGGPASWSHQGNETVRVVGGVGVGGGAVAAGGAAAGAPVDQLVALLAVVVDGDRYEQSAAVGGPVAREDVNVHRVQAVRAVVAKSAAGVRRYLGMAVHTPESGVLRGLLLDVGAVRGDGAASGESTWSRTRRGRVTFVLPARGGFRAGVREGLGSPPSAAAITSGSDFTASPRIRTTTGFPAPMLGAVVPATVAKGLPRATGRCQRTRTGIGVFP